MRRRTQDRFYDALGQAWKWTRKGWRRVSADLIGDRVYVNGRRVHGDEADRVRASMTRATAALRKACDEMRKVMQDIERDLRS